MSDLDNTSLALTRYCSRCGTKYGADITKCPVDGAVVEARNELVGTIFADKYKVTGKLGEGGMAVVYKARHIHMQRDVAIKMLRKHLIADAVAFQRFEQESQAASSLSHPNIVTVYDFGREGEHAYFVMDCVEGATLAMTIEKKGRLPEKQALDIFAQLCEGLSHAHRKGVVHRDLKPSNIVLVTAEDGSTLVKIVDFGIAKIMPHTGRTVQQLTQTGEVFGSPLYMSPEQCLGTSPDQRSDIYSLGCLMYQALTGTLPLIGDTAFETMTKHVNTMPASFKQVDPDLTISEQTEAVVFKCLQKDPAHRYQSAAAVLADLPIEGRAPLAVTAVNEQIRPGAKRNKFLTPVWALSLLVFTSGMVWFIFFFEGSASDRGTTYDKTMWNICMFGGERAEDLNQYALSVWFFDQAQAHARHIQDQDQKLIAALSEQKAPYDRLRQPDKIKAIDVKLYSLTRKIPRERAKVLLKILRAADQGSTSDGSLDAAVVKLPNVVLVALQLQQFGFLRDESELLEVALSPRVYRRALKENDKQIALLDKVLAKCYQAQSLMDKAEPLFEESYKIYQKDEPDSGEAAEALLTLGIFEKDISSWSKADQYLTSALNLARKIKNEDDEDDLYNRCVAAYVDLVKQMQLNHCSITTDLLEQIKKVHREELQSKQPEHSTK